MEAASLEGKPNAVFVLPTHNDRGAASSDGSDLAPGSYQANFGDERCIQHTIKFLGPGRGWQAKARRVESEDVQNTDVKAEDQ